VKGPISEVAEEYKFHFEDILETWIKVDVYDILHPRVQFMYFRERTNQLNFEDAKGTLAVWN